MFAEASFSRLLFTAVLLAVAPACLTAQLPNSYEKFNPRFELVRLPGGEGANNVQCIVQDSIGFVWFASRGGLHRYDGQRFVTYHNDPADSTSIASDYIEWVHVGKNGLLWLGYTWNGLSAFDPATEKCVHYIHEPGNPYSLSDNQVTSITEDRDGVLWAGTHHGLNRLDDREKGKFTRFFHHPDDPGSLSYDLVNSLYLDRQGTLWAGCGISWDGNDPKDEMGGLNRYNGDGSFTPYLHDPADPKSLADNRIRTMYEDSHGNFWVGASGAGLHKMDRASGDFTRLPFDPKHPSRLGSPVLLRNRSKLPGNYQVSFIREDRQGRLWIGAMEGGLNIYDPVSNTMRHFEMAAGMTDSLQSFSLWQFCQTRDGVIWLGCGVGGWDVYRVVPEVQLFPFSAFDPLHVGDLRVSSLIVDTKGYVWLQTTGSFIGVWRFDRKKKEWKRFEYDPPVENREFLDFFELGMDPHGVIWASTEKGLYRMDAGTADCENARFRRDTLIPGYISFPFLWPPFFDRQGNIWVGSFGDGVYRFGPGWRNPAHFRKVPSRPGSLGGDQVERVFEDRQGNLWVMGGSIGIQPDHPLFFDRYEPGDDSFTHFIPPGEMGDPTKCVEDSRGNFWFAPFPYGIRKLNPHTGEYKSFTVANGALPANTIAEPVMGNDGHIWMLGPDMILRLDPETGHFFTYSSRHGVHPLSIAYISGSATGPDEEVIFGVENGIHVFNPEEVLMRASQPPPAIRITGFKIKGQTVLPCEKSSLHRPIWETTGIRLSYHQNLFSFHLSNFDFSGPEWSRLEYMLENYDTGWRSDLLEGEAAYVNVPPGVYVFRARGANSLGAWSEGDAMVRITISPPWWRTWWAYTVFSAFVLFSVYSLYRFHLRARLEHAEAVHLRELDAFKTHLYTNITHEFRTPLTVISGMADQVKENPKEWFNEGLKMIKRNSSRLLELVNQMLDLSKLETKKMALRYQQGDVVNFLKYLVESFHSFALGKGVQIHFLSDLDEMIMDFDAARLQQAISNLLVNAVKFTPAGGNVYLRIAMDEWPSPPAGASSFVVIRVTDTGIGIPAGHLPFIFDRFYQAGEAPSPQEEGTGIGLALAKELINLMRGDISVRSAPGQGAEFMIRLPVTNQAEMLLTDAREPGGPVWPLPVVTETSGETSVAHPHTSPEKPIVLIAEDNTDVVTYLASCLAGEYRLLIAKDGQECIDIAFEKTPDLIVTDVMMPQKDGFEVCEILKNDERSSHIPIILLTARADMESRLAGLERGADAYLAKPFHKRELLVEVKKLLGLRKKLQDHYRGLAGLTSPVPAPKPDAMEDYFVKKVRRIVDAHLEDAQFSVDELCREIRLSHSQLHRKLIALTGCPANHFIRHIRLNKAKELLKDPELSITSIAMSTGFGDVSYFGKVFRQEFGVPPSKWRETKGEG
jgi:signal transduction histidine kinase/ligand-binding sensor domain-containing protein/DNA-binding response OmpR family regulator